MIRKRSPWNYWTLDTTISELKQFISNSPDYKNNASVKPIEDYNTALVRAIYKFGGLKKMNEIYSLGLVIKHRTWAREDVINELKILHSKGIEITQKNLSNLDRHDLLGAMQKFGTLNEFKGVLGLPVTRQKFWSENKIISELAPIINDFGRIPSERVLKNLGRGDLGRIIHKYGGVKKFSVLMNTCSAGYYISQDGHYLQSGYECMFDNILYKYNIGHKVHVKISGQHNFRSDFLINNIHVEICGYDKIEHPGYFERLQNKINLYKDLQLPYLLISKSEFNVNITKLEENILMLLKQSCFSKNHLFTVINNHVDIKPVSYWANLDNIKEELLPLVKKYGRMPLDKELREERKASLVHGIYKFYGSAYNLCKLLNIPCLYKPKGYYTEANALKDYALLSKQYNRFLTLKELQSIKAYGLAGYIQKNGGYLKIRSLINLNYPIRNSIWHKRVKS